jgi:hypothetical protein
MLGRVRHFLTTGAVPPGPASLLRSFASILAANLLQPTIDCIRAIRQGHRALMSILSDLTDGKFRNGAIAPILAGEFWSRGELRLWRRSWHAVLPIGALGLAG